MARSDWQRVLNSVAPSLSQPLALHMLIALKPDSSAEASQQLQRPHMC